MRPTKLAIIYDKLEKAQKRDEEINSIMLVIESKISKFLHGK
jgi:hypothetical protein